MYPTYSEGKKTYEYLETICSIGKRYRSHLHKLAQKPFTSCLVKPFSCSFFQVYIPYRYDIGRYNLFCFFLF